jgi:Ca-activated chloride channel family protein
MTRRALLAVLAAALAAALLVPAPRAQDAERRRGFSIQVTSPENQDVVLGKSRITAKVKIDRPEDVDRVEFLVNDKVIFVDREPPYECMFDFGESTRSWVIRAVAYHKEGITVSDAVVTRKLEVAYFEQVNRVILWASVTDKKDQFVTDLKSGDLRVFEEGKEQTIQEFAAEDRPITLAILIDTSGSMKERMKDVHAAAGAFVDTLRPDDRALVIAFDDKVFLLQDLTADKSALKESITSTEALGATAIYDALHAAFRKLRGIQGRKAIVLLTDGDDTSSQAGHARILEEAKAQNVLIYGIGLDVGMIDLSRKNVLKEFSDVTGGRPYFVKEAKELAGVYQQIAEELRRQYFVTYSTSNKTWDGRWIKVEVKAKNSDYSVRARRGFFAVRSATAGGMP